MNDTYRIQFHVLFSLVFGFCATAASIALAIIFNWLPDKLNIIEVLAVATSYTCTYLCVFQIRWQYLFAFVSTALYVWFFHEEGLYGSMLANIYLPIALIYGWLRWGSDTSTRPVTWTKATMWPIYILVAFLGWYATYHVAGYLGIEIPMLDSGILILTIMAQFLMDNKKMECWIVWAILNVMAIKLYAIDTGAVLVGIQYILFLANTVFAFFMWYRSMGVVRTTYYGEPIENVS